MPDSPARVYECYVEDFDQQAKTLNARSRQGKRFRKVSYLFPYISLSGTGIHFVPEKGAECVILQGGNGLEFVIGFRMPFSADASGREVLPDGTMQMKVIGENGSEGIIRLVRGGTILIESKKSCRTLYSPTHSSIMHIFSNWEMSTPMGFVKWSRPIGQQQASYEAEYRTNVNPDEAFKTKIEMSESQPLLISVSGPKGVAFELKVNPDMGTEVFFASVKFKSLGELHQEASDLRLNLRPILNQRDPI